MFRPSLLALLLLAACATTQGPLAPGSVELDVAPVMQGMDDACGLAALEALCRHHAVELPAEVHADLAARIASGGGLSAGELRNALEQLGFEAFVFEGRREGGATGLLQHLQAGRPPLVLLGARDAAHFALVTGQDALDGRIVLADSRRGRVILAATEFERLWAESQHLVLLAVPR